MQVLLQVDELVHLALHELGHGNARPTAHDLGNILLVVACLGLVAGLAIVPVTLSLSPDPWPEVDPEFQEAVDAVLLPDGIRMDTTVRELLEYDRTFFETNHGQFLALNLVSAAFIIASGVAFLGLALSWRKAVAFGRATILGLRALGTLLVLQFFVGSVAVFVPEAWHIDLFVWSEAYQSAADWLLTGGPTLSSGILFLILSWVLDYGRMIKEEQALTI